jgi:hypothetical protein
VGREILCDVSSMWGEATMSWHFTLLIYSYLMKTVFWLTIFNLRGITIYCCIHTFSRSNWPRPYRFN